MTLSYCLHSIVNESHNASLHSIVSKSLIVITVDTFKHICMRLCQEGYYGRGPQNDTLGQSKMPPPTRKSEKDQV